MSPKRITIVGSLNYDLVTYTDKVPAGGETYQATSFENHLGGKGLNEALATSRLTDKALNAEIRMVGNVGDDSFGGELKQALVDSGVDTTYVNTLNGVSSGVAVIIVESSGENRIMIIAGANGQLKPSDEDYATYFPKDVDQSGDFVMLQNEYPDTVKTIDWLKKNHPKINIAYNPSPFKPELFSEEFLSKIDFLIVNEGESLDIAKSLFSETEHKLFLQKIADNKAKGFEELANKLQTLVNQENICTVIITMGSLGSIVSHKTDPPVFYESAKITTVVDTTGAGDTFFGGVVLKLANGSTINEAIKFATNASALVIQKKGAAESIPTFEEVNKYIL